MQARAGSAGLPQGDLMTNRDGVLNRLYIRWLEDRSGSASEVQEFLVWNSR